MHSCNTSANNHCDGKKKKKDDRGDLLCVRSIESMFHLSTCHGGTDEDNYVISAVLSCPSSSPLFILYSHAIVI